MLVQPFHEKKRKIFYRSSMNCRESLTAFVLRHWELNFLHFILSTITIRTIKLRFLFLISVVFLFFFPALFFLLFSFSLNLFFLFFFVLFKMLAGTWLIHSKECCFSCFLFEQYFRHACMARASVSIGMKGMFLLCNFNLECKRRKKNTAKKEKHMIFMNSHMNLRACTIFYCVSQWETSRNVCFSSFHLEYLFGGFNELFYDNVDVDLYLAIIYFSNWFYLKSWLFWYFYMKITIEWIYFLWEFISNLIT